MKTITTFCLCGVAVLAVVLWTPTKVAHARAPYKKEFDAKYVKAEPKTEEEKAFKAAVETAKCNVCHVGTSKKKRNAYGEAMDEFLEANTKDVAKIQEALEKSAAKPSSAEAGAPTFGELIAKGKLPASDAK